ncbi:MAG: endonuclease V [Thermoplasmata archaeon]|nr:endonuclease V [Thermoplasmata archaeon]
MDLFEEIYRIVRQVPRGKVSTYGAVARALGDIRASRAVGVAMNINPDPEFTPCYRIVNSDGTVGGFSMGVDEKIRRLKEDGIEVVNGRIKNFEQVFFDDFFTRYPLKSLREEQIRLSRRIVIDDSFEKDEFVAGVDVAYSRENKRLACAACVVMDKNLNVVEQKWLIERVDFPYIPTYLAYREIPIITKIIEKLGQKPDMVMVDGNGILHPFGIGIASHLGVVMNIPTIGVAKGLLCGEEKNGIITINGSLSGYALHHSKKPIFVSPGHRVSTETALKIVKHFLRYRLPEPIRHAHILARSKIMEIDQRT